MSTSRTTYTRFVVLGVALAAFSLAACGDGNEDPATPAEMKAALLPESQIDGLKRVRLYEWTNSTDFAVEGLLVGETTSTDAVEATLAGAGFEAGAGEELASVDGDEQRDGPRVNVAVGRFGSEHDALALRDFLHAEDMRQPCAKACVVSAKELQVPEIPGAKARAHTPIANPPQDAPEPFEGYAVVFNVGPVLYVVESWSPPGTLDAADVIATAQAMYDRSQAGATARSGHDPAETRSIVSAGTTKRTASSSSHCDAGLSHVLPIF